MILRPFIQLTKRLIWLAQRIVCALIMNKILPVALAALLILTGCARTYIVTLSNGQQISTSTKPRLVNGFFYFKDSSGQDVRPVLSSNVREIAPTSMASPPPGSQFKPVSTK